MIAAEVTQTALSQDAGRYTRLYCVWVKVKVRGVSLVTVLVANEVERHMVLPACNAHVLIDLEVVLHLV